MCLHIHDINYMYYYYVLALLFSYSICIEINKEWTNFLMILCESFRPKCAEYGEDEDGTGDYSMYSQNKLYDYIDLRAKNRGKNFCFFVLALYVKRGGREKYKEKCERVSST